MAHRTDFTSLPDLAGRTLGGAVIAANDEFFAAKENLVDPAPPEFRPHTFGHRGQVYDGWETRRRRDTGYDWAVVRLGAPGVVRGVDVDTSYFTGNYPEQVSLDATSVGGYPSVDDVLAAEWTPILPPTPAAGDSSNCFGVTAERRFTHVRLNIHPDGGVARLRVYGEVVADPQWFTGTVDLVALENGGTVVGCSNSFYSTPNNLLLPGTARVMGDGWETARRRDGGNDWVHVRLAEEGVVHQADVDTTHFAGNAPESFRLTGEPGGVELLARTRLQPDTRHRFRVNADTPVREVRVDVYPDGGFARLRVHGELTAAGRERLESLWRQTS